MSPPGAPVSGGAPDLATLEAIVTPLERLLIGRRRDAAAVGEGCFLTAAVNTPVDLERVISAAAAWRPGDGAGLSFCLDGPPGTGKSAFVRHLAHRMGRRVVARRGSDLLGPYVGETEQKIADAFTAAEDQDAVLLFDEVDSFLRDRRGASQRWEVSETNEMLQQLESFRGVVACTTNLFADLDQAILRRFVFKIPFLFLRHDQAVAIFSHLLSPLLGRPLDGEEGAAVAAALARLPNLTPGDFAAVERRHRALAACGRQPTAGDLLTDLTAEADAKERTTRQSGFTLSH